MSAEKVSETSLSILVFYIYMY